MREEKTSKVLVVGSLNMGTTCLTDRLNTLIDEGIQIVDAELPDFEEYAHYIPKPVPTSSPIANPLYVAPPQYIEPTKRAKHHNSKIKKRKPKQKKTHRK